MKEANKKIEKELNETNRKLDNVVDMLIKNNNFLEEEIIVDVKGVKEAERLKMIVDSGAPLYIVNERWMKKYIEEKEVSVEELEKTCCDRRFRFGENVYLSNSEIRFPIVIKINNVFFGRVYDKDKICLIGVSDASYSQEDMLVAGDIIMMGNKEIE